MRAVWFGFLGAVLAAGAAQAAPAQCSPDRAVVEIADTGLRYAGKEVERSDLIGKTFEVRRYVDRRKMVTNPASGSLREVGYQAVQISGSAGAFLVQQHHIIGSPSIWGESRVSSVEGPKITWASLGKGERAKVGETLFYVNEGPLSSLALKTVRCR